MADFDNPVVVERDVEWHAIRAQGAGGQNVNKVATAVHLRYDIPAGALPSAVKSRLLEMRSHLIKDGIVIIKAQRYRTLEQNRADALGRLNELVARAAIPPTPRIATRPSRSARRRRTDAKTRRGQVKQARQRPDAAD